MQAHVGLYLAEQAKHEVFFAGEIIIDGPHPDLRPLRNLGHGHVLQSLLENKITSRQNNLVTFTTHHTACFSFGMNLHSNDMTHSVLCQESSSKCSRPSKEAVYKPIDISLKDTSDWARLPTRLPGSDAGSALRSWRIAATLDKARASWAMRVEKIVFTRRFGSEEELFAPSF